MTAQLYVNDAATARQIREIWVNDAGTARRIQEIWVNDNGTARCVYLGDVIAIANATITDLSVDPNDSFAGYELQQDGDIQRQIGAASTDIGDWITPKVNMSAYECRATLNSGDTPTGTLNSWLALSVTRGWFLSQSVVGTQTCNLTIEIRRASDSVVMDSCTVVLTADVES